MPIGGFDYQVIAWRGFCGVRCERVDAVYVASVQGGELGRGDLELAWAEHMPGVKNSNFRIFDPDFLAHLHRWGVLDLAFSDGFV